MITLCSILNNKIINEISLNDIDDKIRQYFKTIDFNDMNKTFDDNVIKIVILELEKRGFALSKSVGRGRYGMINLKKNLVIKIPHNLRGIMDNISENNTFNKYLKNKNDYIPLAHCKLFSFNKSGFNLLLMEYLKPYNNIKDLPEWVRCVDCFQVGYDVKGNLKSFDYAQEI